MSIRISEKVILFFPKEEGGEDVKIFFDTQEASIRSVNEDMYHKMELTKEECVKHTEAIEDTEPVAYGKNSLKDAWKYVVEANEAKQISHQTWFVLWQAIVSNITTSPLPSGDTLTYLLVSIRFCLTIPGYMGWIGLQTLRNLSEPMMDPALEIYTLPHADKPWEDPNRKEWATDIRTSGENPMKRHPIYLWQNETDDWVAGAVLEEHQTTPLMFMNEQSPMQGTLLYHYLGKGKSAASIAISRMYPKRNIMVMVPASLRQNYQKEIAAFGGHEYRVQNEWVFVPMAVKNDRGQMVRLWIPSPEFQYRLPLISFTKETAGKIYGYWLPRTYPGKIPSVNLEAIGSECVDMVKYAVAKMTEKRFRIIHYNAGENTYRQMIRYGLEPQARKSLLRHMMKITPHKHFDVDKEIKPLHPKQETCWNVFSAHMLVNTIINYSVKNPEWNPMNHSLMIVDESHNFISQMMTRLGNLMYLLRMHSIDTRTVLLSGTPIMNHPIEFMYMFDFIKGPQLQFILTTESNPRDPWKPGTKHSVVMVQGKRRILVDHPYMGWVADGTQPTKFRPDPSATIVSMKKYFGREGVPVGSGIIIPTSRHGVVFQRNAKSGQWVVDSQETLATFQKSVLNSQMNGFRTDSDLIRRRLEGVISYQGKTSDISSDFPESKTHLIRCDMEIYQAMLYLQTRIFESDKETFSMTKSVREESQQTLGVSDRRISEAAMNLLREDDDKPLESEKRTKGSGMYRIFSRQACNMTFPPYVPYNIQDKSSSANPVGLIEARDCWLSSHPRQGDHTRSLKDYSTKYANALHFMKRSPGLVLLYTFFRVREGIEMFERILQEYGGRRVKRAGHIEPRRASPDAIPVSVSHPDPVDGGELDIHTTVCIGDLLVKTKVGVNEPIFVEWMGRKDETRDEIHNDTEILVRSCRSSDIETIKWSDGGFVPLQYGVVSGDDRENRGELISVMRSYRNRKGVDAAVLMITKAGAEGLDLKSIRQVHVLEPFWNEVRVQQVVGRGSRNKSHSYLAPEEHTVDNFIYNAVMSSTNLLMSRLIKELGRKSDTEIALALLHMTPDEIAEQPNKNIQSIVSLNQATDWGERLTGLYAQFVNDSLMTSDEFVRKTSERKQILIEQALRLFSLTSIESLRNKTEYPVRPVFLTPFAVYMNPSIPLELYLKEFRDQLEVRRSSVNPEPKGCCKIPVYYVPFYVIDSATNHWKQQIMELNAQFTLKRNGSMVMTRESPVMKMVDIFVDGFKGKRFSEDIEVHRKKYKERATKFVTSPRSNVGITYMSDSHKDAIMQDLIDKKSRASMDYHGGVYRKMILGPSASPPFVWKSDETMDLRLSERIQTYWKAHGFKS